MSYYLKQAERPGLPVDADVQCTHIETHSADSPYLLFHVTGNRNHYMFSLLKKKINQAFLSQEYIKKALHCKERRHIQIRLQDNRDEQR